MNIVTRMNIVTSNVTKAYFLPEWRRFFLTLDMFDILCLVYSNFCKEKTASHLKVFFTIDKYFSLFIALNLLCYSLTESVTVFGKIAALFL